MSSFEGLPYVGFDSARAAGKKMVLCDAAQSNPTSDDIVLVLTHTRGNVVPMHLKDDLSTQICLRALRDSEVMSLARGADCVSNDHFDIDGLCAVLALWKPDVALAHAELLVEVSRCGDFRKTRSQAAAAVCMALTAVMDGRAVLPCGPLEAETMDGRALYEALLPVLAEMLEDPQQHPLLAVAQPEVQRLQRSNGLAALGQIMFEELDDVGITVVTVPDHLRWADVHPITVHNRARNYTTLLLAPGDGYYFLHQRYERAVDYVSVRTLHPQLDLTSLAEALTAAERKGGNGQNHPGWAHEGARSWIAFLSLVGSADNAWYQPEPGSTRAGGGREQQPSCPSSNLTAAAVREMVVAHMKQRLKAHRPRL